MVRKSEQNLWQIFDKKEILNKILTEFSQLYQKYQKIGEKWYEWQKKNLFKGKDNSIFDLMVSFYDKPRVTWVIFRYSPSTLAAKGMAAFNAMENKRVFRVRKMSPLLPMDGQ